MNELQRIAQLENELYQQLADSRECALIGIVGPSGFGASQSQGDELWSVMIDLVAWRVEGEPIQTNTLVLRRRVTDEELDDLESEIEDDSIIRVRGRIAEENAFGSPQALLEQYLGRESSDHEMEVQRERLLEPKTFVDPQFGLFTLDRRVNWYECTVEWGGAEVKLRLDAQSPEGIAGVLRVARAVWSDQAGWKARIESYAVQELLPLKNEAWRDEDEEVVSANEFIARMTLQSIVLDPEGEFAFWHDDGDLFYGHAIEITGSVTEGPNRAGIPG